jgi:hypothetical protein
VPDLKSKKDAIDANKLKAEKKSVYFDDKKEDDMGPVAPSKQAASEFIRNINEKYSNKEVYLIRSFHL